MILLISIRLVAFLRFQQRLDIAVALWLDLVLSRLDFPLLLSFFVLIFDAAEDIYFPLDAV